MISQVLSLNYCFFSSSFCVPQYYLVSYEMEVKIFKCQKASEVRYFSINQYWWNLYELEARSRKSILFMLLFLSWWNKYLWMTWWLNQYVLGLEKGHEYLWSYFYALLLAEWNKYLLTTWQLRDLCGDKERNIHSLHKSRIGYINTRAGKGQQYSQKVNKILNI